MPCFPLVRAWPELVDYDSEDIVLTHDGVVFATDFDFGARILAEKNLVPFCNGQPFGLSIVGVLPGPTATTMPSTGFSFAVSGMIIPPLDISWESTRLTINRSCNGCTFMLLSFQTLALPAVISTPVSSGTTHFVCR